MIETFVLAFLLAVVMIRALMPMAVHLGLVDAPCVRKRHKGFVVEIACGLAAVVYCDVRIYDIGRLVPSFGGTLLVGGSLVWLSIPLTIVGMVGVINAINMTDGVDGLAGGLATLTFAGLAFLSYPSNPDVALQLMTLVAALTGFLFFNSRLFGRTRAAIFMGDGGSIFIGFALAWYLIMLSQGSNAVLRPVDALWLVALPLLDIATIMVRRMRHGRSPFAADREHIHHILLLSGFGASRTVLIILAAQLCCVLLAVASARAAVPEWFVFGLFVALAAFYFGIMNFAWKVMKRVKHFREWAGFEDRRSELSQGIGRSPGLDRRNARARVPVDADPIEVEATKAVSPTEV
jgi:UDP-GlcNAc:undecaprenyl-phosphate GlcNAc-1-phosphate transferase